MSSGLLLPAPLQHRNFVDAREKVATLMRACPGGKAIALIGPTQAGKSVIFRQLVSMLTDDTKIHAASAQPVVSLTLATSQDGRISPKHVALKLLKALRHPLYVHIGELDEYKHHTPSRGRDESTMRIALESAMSARRVLYVALDEAHHLTHTRDPALRANVLQSIKCLGAIDRTLFLCGGYELAYRGLFDSAHFSGRLVVVELPPYGDAVDDFLEWCRILKAVSSRLPLQSPTLLVDEAEPLLLASNGSFGLLEKILWKALVHCRSGARAIDRILLNQCFPSREEHKRVAEDIKAGRQAVCTLRPETVHRDEPEALKDKSAKSRRPFRRNPDRNIARQRGMSGRGK